MSQPPGVPGVDVLLVNYRTPRLTSEAVAALAEAAQDILVWDNSGDLDESDVPAARLLSNGRNIFYAEASNILFRMGTAPLVLLLNPDARCTPADLSALVDALGEHPECWGAAPRLVSEQGEDQSYRRRLPTLAMLLADRLPRGHALMRGPWEQLYCRDLDPSVGGTVEQPAAACLLLRRELIGPDLFDEAYPLFGNDLELAKRLAVHGPCRYVPVRVVHVGGASISEVGTSRRGWLRLQYDDALRRYARQHVRGWWLLEPLFLLRRIVTRVTVGVTPPSA